MGGNNKMEVTLHKQENKSIIGERLRHLSNRLVDEFVHGGHLLGINFAFIGLAVMVIFDFSIHLPILFMGYLLTQAVYGFDHYHDLQQDSLQQNSRVAFVKRTKSMYPVRLLFFTGSFFILLFFFGNLLTIVLGLSILLLGIGYSLYLKRLTKYIPGFKNVYVAATVSLAIVFTALFYQNVLSFALLFFTGYAAISYFMNCNVCDVKDMESDKKQGLKTLPLLFGKQRFFYFILFVNTLSLLVLVSLLVFHLLPTFFGALIGFNILWYLVILKGMQPDVDYHWFSSRIIDSMEIFSFLFLFVGKTLLTVIVV